MTRLQDGFGRRLEYLRLSVTERCNFRCSYCLPGGCTEAPGARPLTIAEIGRLVRAFAELGVWRVRLTGGEPTLRSDIPEIVRRVGATPGVRSIGLTTNGYRLVAMVRELRDAGLTSVNVSIDSLDAGRFRDITGYDRLDRIVAGVEAAVAARIPSVKVNTVVLRGMEARDVDCFLSWTRELPITVRFIELMETGENGAFFARHHVSADEMDRVLASRGWSRLPKDPSGGPAANYAHPIHAGKVGLIAPYSAGFCESCNRVRVSAAGDLRLCLFGDAVVPLRPLLERDEQRRELVSLVASSVMTKPASHLLRQGSAGGARNFAAIGG